MIATELTRINQVIQEGPYSDNWDSLATHPIPKWYRDAKFGAFIHWGVYSVPAYYNEWYPRLMHYKGHPVYYHHNKKYGRDYPYRKFIESFLAERFDANSWVRTLKDVGIQYMMPVGEHHDGFKMFDSNLSPYTSVNMGPKRDVLGELKAASEQLGMVFATSSHRAENFWFYNGAKTLPYAVEAADPKYEAFYGKLASVNPHNGLNALMQGEHGIVPTTEWLEEWLVHSVEMLDKYEPQMFYFDWWVSTPPFKPYLKKLLAYYYNRALVWGKEVCYLSKNDAVMYGGAVTNKERGQLGGVSPHIWQSETSTARNAWCYCENNKWKPAAELAAVLADVISKNGNLTLNVCPQADGTFCKEEQAILQELGAWTKRNHAAIWGTVPYKVWGEGKRRKSGAFKENYAYTKKDIRYTYKTGYVYAFLLAPDPKGKALLTALAKHPDQFNFVVQEVTLLGSTQKIGWEHKKDGLHLSYQTEQAGSKMPLCFQIKID